MFAVSSASAQRGPLTVRQLDHRSWTIRDGAPPGIHALAQSADGVLWIGTVTGLYQFDGVRFEPFEPPASQALPSLGILQLLALPDTTLWIGYNHGGVSQLAHGRVVSYTQRDGLPEGTINALARDSTGDVWAATTTGLARMHSGRWQRVGPESGFPGGMTSDLLVDRRGALWAPANAGVFILPRGASRFVRQAPSLDPNGLGAGVPREAPDGSVWGASVRLGLTRLSDVAGRPTVSQRAAERVRQGYALMIDRNANAWIDSPDGFFRVPLAADGKGEHGALLPAEPVRLATSAPGGLAPPLEDREGNVWVGTSGGLERFRETKLTSMALPDSMYGPSLAPAGDASVWLTSFRHPLFTLGDRVVNHGGVPADMSCAYRDLRGGIWFGGWAGMWHAPAGTSPSSTRFTRVPLPREPGIGDVQAIAETLDGDLWVSIRGGKLVGVFRRRGAHWSLAPLPPSFSGEMAFTAVADSAGRVWLGYRRNRLVLFSADSARTYFEGDGLRVGSVTALLVRGPRLWIGGEWGLTMFLDGRFHAVRATELLRGVTGIVETANGDLWLNGAGGITHLEAAELSRALQDSSYRARAERLDYRDGLQGAATQVRPLPTAIQGADGRIWFTTETGVASIDPKHVGRNALPPPIQIRAMSAGGKRYDGAGRVALPAGTSQVQIAYTALSFAMPDRVRFRYRLVGVDTAWSEAGSRREAYFMNLQPRTYRFQVTAANEDGVWNPEGAFIDFAIAPTFYQSIWFRAILVAAFAALLWALHRVRIRQLALRERRFRDTIETIPAMAFTARPDGSHTFANRRWVEYTGQSVEQASNAGWQLAVHPDDLDRALDCWRLALATGDALEYEVRLQGATGSYRGFLVRAVPLKDKRQQVTRWYGVATDIEERKRAEQERRESEEELARARSELAHVARATTLGALTASIAHEVNQPLSGIVTNASTCLRMLAADPPNVQGAVETARRTIRDGHRASEVITRLRGLFAKKDGVTEPVDLNEATREIIALSLSELQRNRVAVSAELADDLPRVRGDRVQLQQVILNLIMNASDAMSAVHGRPREMVIRTDREEDGAVCLSVRDNGAGFDPEARDRLFEAFYTTKDNGMGVGLSISRTIIERHRGHLRATRNQGHGATFAFSIPEPTDPQHESETQ
jgi:PAS domain S-box-containing protein